MSTLRVGIGLAFLILLLTACSTDYPETCNDRMPVGLADVSEIAADDSLPFQFPLDESLIDDALYFGWFAVSNQCRPGQTDCYVYPERLFHAAEDYKRPPGTPVYTMADGRISFSGRAGGYGWLIIIDHPQANLYSLYGHLSPSRWRLEEGAEVQRGELIGYLGDSDENGGSAEQPLVPHLHFGIRAGQTADYPPRGEWRFHGGWIKPCPQDVGWLQPSLIITGQDIPAGGFNEPDIEFWTRWWLEILFSGSYGFFGALALVVASRKQTRAMMILPGFIVIAAGFIFERVGLVTNYLVVAIGLLILAGGIYLLFRRPAHPTAET